MQYTLLSSSVELSDRDGTAELYEKHYFNNGKKVVKYCTKQDNEHRYWLATKDPEKLTTEERHRILNYCLVVYDKSEIVNYSDLFIQGEFIIEITKTKA